MLNIIVIRNSYCGCGIYIAHEFEIKQIILKIVQPFNEFDMMIMKDTAFKELRDGRKKQIIHF